MEFIRRNKKSFIVTLIMCLCILLFLGLYIINKGTEELTDESAVENNKLEQLHKQEEKRIKEENGITTVDNENDIEVVVNKKRKLPDGYHPNDLVVPNVHFSFSGIVEKSYMRKEAADALENLFSLAQKDGIILYAVSGFRSYERQVEIYTNNVQANGQEATDKVSAQPGFSEHQTGLAMDVSSESNGFNLTESFADTKEGKWLAENAYRSGFIIRYLEGRETITGYSYEPWHIRYVGDIAKTIYEQNTTLEEFFRYE